MNERLGEGYSEKREEAEERERRQWRREAFVVFSGLFLLGLLHFPWVYTNET